MENQLNVPMLRFPEFSGVWYEVSLEDVSDNIMYGMNAAATDYDGQHKYIRITDIDENTRSFTPNPLTSPEGEIDDKFKLCENDIVFARTGASVGKTYLYNALDGNLYFAGFLIKFSIIKGHAYFVYTQTLREAYRKWVKLMSMRSGQPGINAEEYKIYSFFTTSLSEQKRISTFLISIDDKLSKLELKRSLLYQYKKGVMQKLFSQELRFKDEDGRNYSDWDEKKLGELFAITSSKRVFESEWTKEGVPFYRAREVVKLSECGFVDNELFISFEMYDEYKSRYGVPKKNDLLVTGVGTIGRLYVVKEDDRFYFKDGNIIWFKSQNLVNSDFVKHLFRASIIKKQIEDNASITTVGTYTIQSANNTSIPFPCLSEQIKIASFLNSLDEKIDKCSLQIEKMQQWKKGLLQQMFV